MNGRIPYIYGITTIIIGLIFMGRLLYIQVIDDTYRNSPLNNASVTAKYDYPPRGLIYDRNGKLLVGNKVSYDIMVIPRDCKPIDTLEFCKLLDIDRAYFDKQMRKARTYSYRKPSIFLELLSKEAYATLQEKMFMFKGFYIQKRILRTYPYPNAANVLGYISQVNEAMTQSNPYYQMGELIGTQGIEKQYEKELRGIKGVKFVNRNIHNREIGAYKDGKYDTLAVAGKDLTLALDIDLQVFGEWLLANKKGGIVAIEPKTGEILALVTAPSYDPNLMVGRERSKNFNRLYLDDINKPLLDRSLQAQYSPGSTFKMINGLVGLALGSITEHTTAQCYGGYKYGRGGRAFMGCHCGTNGRPMQLKEAIFRSCNTYFSKVYEKSIDLGKNPHQGYHLWAEGVKSFGLGNYLGYDLPVGQKGLIPDTTYYNKYYPTGFWRASTTISNAIGQGEIITTPIQLANMTSAIANKGYYIRPHIVKEIEHQPINNPKYTEPVHTIVKPELFDPVIDGMQMVFETQGGTAFWHQIPGIEICGKTGTAENFIRVNGVRTQLDDHSIFISFAPKNDPKIAIAVFVENGGYGSRIAAPIASMMTEKYLTDSLHNPLKSEQIHNINLYEETYDKQLELFETHDSLP
ncbi:MAG: penicillin-binding protein 2 [Flavobacteriia bacterium]|nr:MAG: penicillin-binding protein 2 [Flavobacteriia bacterium]